MEIINIFKLFGTVSLKDDASKSLDNLEKKAESTQGKLGGLSKKLGDLGSKTTEMGKSLTKKLTVPIMALGGASFKMAADVQDSMGAVDQVFGNSSKEIQDWTRQLPAYYGVSRAQALEHASVMGSMLKNIGGQTEEVAATQTKALVELAGDLSAMYGGSVEESMSAITSALAGNSQAMRKYGTAILDADVKQKAFELGLYSGKGAMSAQAKQAGTLAVMMDQTADAQGQAGREADQANGSLKQFTTTIKNLSVDIGEVLLPIVTPMVQKLSEWIQKFSNLDDGTKKTIVVVAGLVAAIGPVLLIFGKFATAISAIIGLITTVTGAFAVGGAAAGVFGGILAFLTSPVTLVVAAVMAVIAVFALLYTKSETFRNLINGVVEGVKNIFLFAFDVIKAYVNGLISFWTGAFNIFKNVIQFAFDAVAGYARTLVAVWTAIFNTISNVTSTVSNAIKNTVVRVFDGIKNAMTTPIEKAKEVISGIVNAIKGFFTGMKLKFPEIKMPKLPKFNMEGKFGLNPISVPKLSVNWNKEGGIFDKATIFNTNKGLQGVGEAGAEAILPLDKLKDWFYRSMDAGIRNIADLVGNRPQFAGAGVNNVSSVDNRVVNVNISGDWTVDSDERQASVIDELTKELDKYFRYGGDK